MNAKEARKLSGIETYDAERLVKDIMKYVEEYAKKKETSISYMASNNYSKDAIYIAKNYLENQGYIVSTRLFYPGLCEFIVRWA